MLGMGQMGPGGSENTPTLDNMFTYDPCFQCAQSHHFGLLSWQNKHSIVIVKDQYRANYPQMTYITWEGHGDWHEPRNGVIVAP